MSPPRSKLCSKQQALSSSAPRAMPPPGKPKPPLASLVKDGKKLPKPARATNLARANKPKAMARDKGKVKVRDKVPAKGKGRARVKDRVLAEAMVRDKVRGKAVAASRAQARVAPDKAGGTQKMYLHLI